VSGWDERYAKEEYVYGIEPNRWLVAHAGGIKPGGRVLSLGEGEGRNAVWLARQGFAVEAVDGSAVGLEKAGKLAAQHGVVISTLIADLGAYAPAAGQYDAVALIFVHLPPHIRALVHSRAAAALAPGGVIIIEAFTPRQLSNSSGGPRQSDMLYDEDTLRRDFSGLQWAVLREAEMELDEGPFHRGRAAVVHGVGRRAP
jgi:2-polyprenyl-3-methyl-5-hydroxy-6-metoxy-1,4-benzoquinol methylase